MRRCWATEPLSPHWVPLPMMVHLPASLASSLSWLGCSFLKWRWVRGLHQMTDWPLVWLSPGTHHGTRIPALWADHRPYPLTIGSLHNSSRLALVPRNRGTVARSVIKLQQTELTLLKIRIPGSQQLDCLFLENRDEAEESAELKNLFPRWWSSWCSKWFGEKHWQSCYELGLWRQTGHDLHFYFMLYQAQDLEQVI